MIKSAIFDTKQVIMQCPLFISFILWVVISVSTYAQYTETINTNRPGTSQGAFSVGKNVVQFETGLAFGSEKHSIFNEKTNTTEFQYNIRVGLLKEQLEFGLEGSYLNLSSSNSIGNSGKFKRKGFPFNALGVKYLIYDPYKYKRERSANILSWKANRKFQWKKLIPAVSAYAAANFTSSSGDLAFQNNPDNRATKVQPNITPKFIISAHNVWSEKLVFIVNLVSRNLGSEFPEYRFITTTTYNFNEYFSFFGEYEAVSSQIYKDHLLKAGGAFLLTPDLQFDARILGNFKDTPSIFNVALGASYRLDYHKNSDNEYIDTGESYDAKKYVELIKKDIESGHLDESVLTGKLQSVLENDVIVERFKGVDLESYAQEEEEEEEFDEDFDEDIEEEDTRIKWWQIGKKRRLRKKALSDTTSTRSLAGTGGRRSDFLDDDFIKQKQLEITPAERTPEELAELELRREEEAKKKKKGFFGKNSKANEVYIDQVTGDTIPPPDYSGMSRKERKAAEKQHKDLFSLDDEGLDDFVESIEQEQSDRDIAKERKRKEKEARKLAKQEAKRKKKEGYLDENEEEESFFGEEEKPKPEIKPEKKVEEEEDDGFDIEKELANDKELQRLEAEIAREEEKERKRLEKEAAKNAKANAAKEKLNAKQSTEQEKERIRQEAIEAKRLAQEKLAAEKRASSESKAQAAEAERNRKIEEARAKELEKQRAAEEKAEANNAFKEAQLKREREKALQKQKEVESKAKAAKEAREQKLKEQREAALRKAEAAKNKEQSAKEAKEKELLAKRKEAEEEI